MACGSPKPVRGRFAPSPSGRLHAGNVLALLVAWICALRDGGDMALRMEDVDHARCSRELALVIEADLERLGLTWTGDVMWQSERDRAYDQAFRRLKDDGLVYPCFCTRAAHFAANPTAPAPDVCRCREIDAGRADELVGTLEHSWRFDCKGAVARFGTPDPVTDLFQGPIPLPESFGTNPMLVRKDGGYAYQLAVVVDDAAQNVTQVVRGCDLIDQTYVQRLLGRALGLPELKYGHLPLLVDGRGVKLAKSHASAHLDEMVEERGSVEAVLGHIAHVAGIVPVERPYSADELLEVADLSALDGVTEIVWR